MKNLDLLIPQKKDDTKDVWRWATVTASDPLRIRMDGEEEPLDITPDTLVGGLTVGRRVWTQTSGRRILVTGAAGGAGSGGAGGSASVNLGAGQMFVTMASIPPAGTLLCDGSTVSRTTYAALFSAIGTTFNTGGEAATDFRLPNLKGRVPVGRDAGQVEFDVLGELGGAKTHTLSTNEIPAHAHSQNGHTWAWGTGGLFNSVYLQNAIAAAGNPPSNNAVTSQGGGGWVGTNNAGGGAAHNNLQPYIVGNWVITTGTEIGAAPAAGPNLLGRDYVETVGSGGTAANGAQGVVLASWTPATGPRGASTKAQVTATTSLYCVQNQDARSVLQARIAGGAWFTIHSAFKQNRGAGGWGALNSSLSGWITYTPSQSIEFRVYVDVAGGGREVLSGGTDFSVTYFQ